MAATRQSKNGEDFIVIKASGAETATAGDQSAAVNLPAYVNGLVFVVDLTVTEDDVDDTLNLFIQTKIDGTNWVDVVHFTEMLGNGNAKRFVAKIAVDTAQAEFEAGAALGAAAVRHLFGDAWRARWVIVDPTGSDASFTFSITAMPM